GDGDTGTVNKDDVNVRAGSALNAMKTTVQGKLTQGQSVKILGEQDEYYKIAPPADAFVYVKKDFVTSVKAVPQVAQKENEATEKPVEPKGDLNPPALAATTQQATAPQEP